jgi:hypothetical protein
MNAENWPCWFYARLDVTQRNLPLIKETKSVSYICMQPIRVYEAELNS